MRILIAEDNVCFRQLICVILTGHNVIVAWDGEEAVESAQCYQPDVILMDVMMPELDGFGALERLKADEATAHIPVVLMSADYTQPEHIERGLGLGAAEYLVKPFNLFDLPQKLKGHVVKEKARQAGRAPETPI